VAHGLALVSLFEIPALPLLEHFIRLSSLDRLKYIEYRVIPLEATWLLFRHAVNGDTDMREEAS